MHTDKDNDNNAKVVQRGNNQHFGVSQVKSQETTKKKKEEGGICETSCSYATPFQHLIQTSRGLLKMRQSLIVQKSETAPCTGAGFLFPAANGDSLISILVMCRSNVNTSMATTPAHLLPAITAVITAELKALGLCNTFKETKRELA